MRRLRVAMSGAAPVAGLDANGQAYGAQFEDHCVAPLRARRRLESALTSMSSHIRYHFGFKLCKSLKVGPRLFELEVRSKFVCNA